MSQHLHKSGDEVSSVLAFCDVGEHATILGMFFLRHSHVSKYFESEIFPKLSGCVYHRDGRVVTGGFYAKDFHALHYTQRVSLRLHFMHVVRNIFLTAVRKISRPDLAVARTRATSLRLALCGQAFSLRRLANCRTTLARGLAYWPRNAPPRTSRNGLAQASPFRLRCAVQESNLLPTPRQGVALPSELTAQAATIAERKFFR